MSKRTQEEARARAVAKLCAAIREAMKADRVSQVELHVRYQDGGEIKVEGKRG